MQENVRSFNTSYQRKGIIIQETELHRIFCEEPQSHCQVYGGQLQARRPTYGHVHQEYE